MYNLIYICLYALNEIAECKCLNKFFFGNIFCKCFIHYFPLKTLGILVIIKKNIFSNLQIKFERN